MKEFEKAIEEAVNAKHVLNSIIEARLRDSDWEYKKTFGKVSLDEDAPGIDECAIFSIFSCTKLITAFCVLQRVEKGLITLDEPLTTILPEYASPTLISSITPLTLSKALTPITLRHFLTHTSGLPYASHPLISAWSKTLTENLHRPKYPPTSPILRDFLLPLVFEPGMEGKWTYGCALDWAGVVVSRLNGNISLGEYMATNIFSPLGMTSTTFHILRNPDMVSRLCPRVRRRSSDGVLEMDEMKSFPLVDPEDGDESGGGGLFTTARDFVRVLESLVRDDGKVLQEKGEGMRELFKVGGQLVDCTGELQEVLSGLGIARAFGGKGVGWNWGLGGLVAVDGVEGLAGVGTMWWDGAANCYWFIDRANGTCGFYGSQLFPPSDNHTMALFKKFQSEVIKRTNLK